MTMEINEKDFIDINKEDIKTLEDLIHYNIDDAALFVANKMKECGAGECDLRYVQFMLMYKNREMLKELHEKMDMIMEHLKIHDKVETTKSNYQLKDDD